MVTIKSKLEFDELIAKEKVFVDFFADWCGPCKMFDMVVEEVSGEREDITFVRVDSDRFRGIAKEYHVLSVPHSFIFSNGKVVREQKGLMRKEELNAFLDE